MPFGKGLDVIQQAQSGTGKTATFCAGILQRLDYGELDCQALVLAPTRELAQQIEKVMRALGDYLEVSTGSKPRSGSDTSHRLSLHGNNTPPHDTLLFAAFVKAIVSHSQIDRHHVSRCHVSCTGISHVRSALMWCKSLARFFSYMI